MRATCLLIIGVSALAVGWMSAAVARNDSGEHTFFLERADRGSLVFRPTLEPVQSPPLTIRVPARRGAARHAPPVGRAVAGRPVPAVVRMAAATPAGPQPAVPIFEDGTLRRGDAVMLDQGLHLFEGTGRFPYGRDDFVKVDGGRRLSRSFRTALVEIARNYTGRN